MDVHRSYRSLPGHPGCGMITLTYDFRGGVQVCVIQQFLLPGKQAWLVIFQACCLSHMIKRSGPSCSKPD